ncbi:hypothetical protein HYQ46_013375 [Verticillium longisporum]|nr:hypothetical protein HYQ46_013375 [Verticillium longisporum]
MKEAIVTKEITVQIKDVERPKPGPGEVLTKVIVAEGALKSLKDGSVRAKKMVIRIGETEGVTQ